MPLDRKSTTTGHHGITFTVFKLTVSAYQREQLKHLIFTPAHSKNSEISTAVIALFDRIFPAQRTCFMTISVSQPLKRLQADAINDARSTAAKVSAALASSAFKPSAQYPRQS
ncbi:MAG: hypothetical protein LBJ33_20275 [Pseudomonas putida]|jgi:hypothetical protein|nr:hypothetical protein [Pseudomonas putida]